MLLVDGGRDVRFGCVLHLLFDQIAQRILIVLAARCCSPGLSRLARRIGTHADVRPNVFRPLPCLGQRHLRELAQRSLPLQPRTVPVAQYPDAATVIKDRRVQPATIGKMPLSLLWDRKTLDLVRAQLHRLFPFLGRTLGAKHLDLPETLMNDTRPTEKPCHIYRL